VGLYALVIGDLGSDVGAGFGIGFNGFESVSYPFILGIAMAGASLVGRNLGAGREAGARQAVKHVRWMSRVVGLGFALIFYYGAEYIVPLYTSDPGVLVEAIRYVTVLAWSQALVAEEVVNEKILYGAGHPQAIPWISTLGNVARLPLGWYLAVHLGYGAAGLWWTINITTLLKGLLFYREVRRDYWVKPIASLSPTSS
jgi:Na+-driven multidrug efflux pump